MGFKVGAQAKVVAVTEQRGITKARLSISYKDKNTSKYVVDFDDFVCVFGASKGRVFKGDIIEIKGCDVTTKEVNGKKYTTISMYAHDIVKSKTITPETKGVPYGGQQADSVVPKFGETPAMPTDIDSGGLPF